MKKKFFIYVLLLLFSTAVFAQEQSDVKMDSITVKGDKRKASNIEKAGTVSTVSAQDIEEKSSKLLKDSLNQIPGIQVTTQRNGTRTFSMRGYSMSKVAVLCDGIPVINTYSGSLDIDNIGLLDVSEIVVCRGTTSALYGTRGSAGSVNIIKNPPSSPYLKAAAETDHLGNCFISLANGAAFEKFYYTLSGSFDESKGYTVSKRLDGNRRISWLKKLGNLDVYHFTIDDLMRNDAVKYYVNDTGRWDHTSHTKYKTNIKAGYRFTDSIEAGITGFCNHSRMRNSFYSSDVRSQWAHHKIYNRNVWVTPDYENFLVNQSSFWPKYDDYAVSPYFNFRNGDFSLKANIYYYAQNNRYVRYTDPQESAQDSTESIGDLTWSIWTNSTLGLSAYPSWKISDRQTLKFAFNWYRSGHIEEKKAYNDRSVNIIKKYGRGKYKTVTMEADYLTLAAEDDISINSYTALTVGLSYDAQNFREYKKYTAMYDRVMDVYMAKDDSMLYGTRDSFNPVIGITGEPYRNFLKWRSSMSYKTDFPSLQAYSGVELITNQNGVYSMDSKFKPERSLNFNAGGEIKLFGTSLVLSEDYFFSYYFDKILKYYSISMGDYAYKNVDACCLMGTETAVTWGTDDVLDTVDLSLGLSHTFNYSRNLSKMHNSSVNRGKYFEFLPAHKFTVDFRAIVPEVKTGFYVFGYFSYDQRFYTMNYRPESEHWQTWSTKCFRATKLNNPLMIDAKLSRKFIFMDSCELEAYVMCKNIFDDYLADPFNPGPGRTWCFGAKAGF